MYPASPIHCHKSSEDLGQYSKHTHAVDLWVIKLEVNKKFGGEKTKDTKEYGQYQGRHDTCEIHGLNLEKNIIKL